jgi:hypothetical protein
MDWLARAHKEEEEDAMESAAMSCMILRSSGSKEKSIGEQQKHGGAQATR